MESESTANQYSLTPYALTACTLYPSACLSCLLLLMPRLRSCWPSRVEEIFLYSPRKFSIVEVNMLYISIMFGASEHIEVVSICLLLLLAIWYIQSTLFSKLRRVPGPILARFTAFYRASFNMVWHWSCAML